MRAGLRSFAGVPHRLQEVARREGVLYVNDSKATNVASTLVALQAFPEGGVHLILGGQGKSQDFAPLREPVAASCRAVYLIGEDAPADRRGAGRRASGAAARMRRPGAGRGGGERGGERGRDGAALPGLRQLRPVRRLRGAGRAVRTLVAGIV